MSTIPISEIQNYVGANLGASEWMKIDQARVNSFAEVTGDFQFIHLDEEAASKTPFGGTIAHGFLTLSLVASLGPQKSLVLESCQMSINYGSDKVRFLHPVRVGKRIRAHWKLLSVIAKTETNYLFKYEVSVEIEGVETPALIYESLLMQVVAA